MSVEVQDNQVASQEVSLTEKAIQEVRNIKKDQNIPQDYYLRMGVKGGGCSGFTYALAFDENANEGDNTYEFEDVKVLVDYKSLMYLAGITLDFQDGLNGRGFTFDNPNATRTCGCGSSFGA